jgi:general secretion pathway protein D
MLLAAFLAALLAAGGLDARTRRGDRLSKDAHDAEARKDWDRAVELYQQAVDEDPRDAGYMVGLARARFQAAQMHVELGRDLRSQGKLAEAMAEFQRAIVIDPSTTIALQEVKRTQEMLAQPAAGPDALLTPAERAEREAAERIASIMGVPRLNPPVKRVGPLRMNSQPINILYQTVASIAGVTIVWDSTWTRPTRNWDVEIPEMAVEQALDYLATVTRTFWKPLNATTIFVTEESATKRRDFEDNVVKTFFITNAATVQEFQEIATAVRTITDLRRVYTYNAMKAMVVRGPADAVALAEKLVKDLDRPKAEVVVDVVIMQVSSARSRDLAATLASAGKAGLNVPVNFTPQGAPTTPATGGALPITNNSITLARLGRLSSADFSTTLPGALLQALLTDNSTKVLNAPQVRASDGQKGRLEIGDRVPIASGSFASGVGGTFPGVNTQFQYIPVGVIVDITPQMHSTNEVTLHIEMEVSQVKGFNDIGGIQQPVIGQSKTTADLRLQEGEVNILSGLMQSQDTTSVSGIPGLVNIPVLGKVFFGSQSITQDRSELVIALIPHIVRTPDYSRENLRGVFAGADQQLYLRYAPEEDALGSAPTPGAPAGPSPGQPAPPAAAPPAAAPTPTAPPQAQPQPGAGQPPAAPPPAPPPAGAARVSFQPGVVTVAPNTPFTLNVQLENVTNASAVMPVRVSWDPALLRLNDIAPAELMSRDGGRVTSVKDIRNDTGQATLSIARAAGSPGVTGSGPVATLTFTALASGSGRVTVTEMAVMDAQNRALPVTLGTVPVAIQ